MYRIMCDSCGLVMSTNFNCPYCGKLSADVEVQEDEHDTE